MEKSNKEAYHEPLLVKHGSLVNLTNQSNKSLLDKPILDESFGGPKDTIKDMTDNPKKDKNETKESKEIKDHNKENPDTPNPPFWKGLSFDIPF